MVTTEEPRYDEVTPIPLNAEMALFSSVCCNLYFIKINNSLENVVHLSKQSINAKVAINTATLLDQERLKKTHVMLKLAAIMRHRMSRKNAVENPKAGSQKQKCASKISDAAKSRRNQ